MIWAIVLCLYPDFNISGLENESVFLETWMHHLKNPMILVSYFGEHDHEKRMQCISPGFNQEPPKDNIGILISSI